MKAFWMKFEDGSEACCEGQSEFDAIRIAEKLGDKKVKDGEEYKYKDNPNVQTLPYPARPVIWQFEHPLFGKTPLFCHSPRECCGKGSCPKDHACTE